MAFKPSKYQQAIFDAFANTNANIVINAVAGSGKTTTIVKLTELIRPGQFAIFLAFNKSIATELRAKIPMRIEVKTLHANGYNELRFKYGKHPDVRRETFLDEGKIGKIVMAHVNEWDEWEDEADRASYASRVEKIVDIMRFSLATRTDDIEDLCYKHGIDLMNGEIDAARQVLAEANADNLHFDFTDMIYRPAIGDWRLKQFHVVIVDECQDLNKAQQAMIKKMLKPGGRIVAVGDPRQSIYGFAGADVESFDRLKNMLPNTVEMPLSCCYRCDEEIIRHAKDVVPWIESREGAGAGEVRTGSVQELTEGDMVLCRNTRPLVALCMRLIGQGRKATIKGADIGKGLAAMVKATKRKTMDAAFNKMYKELGKLEAKAKMQFPTRNPDEVSYYASYNDKIEALMSISKARGCKTPETLCQEIDKIFVDDVTGIVLSTMHKAKGLEGDRVFVIERFRLPAPFAKQEWEMEQESNLDYVARTRAKRMLVYVDDFCSEPEKKDRLDRSLADIRAIEAQKQTTENK
jgi:superfamily I DNA/RNA helicase